MIPRGLNNRNEMAGRHIQVITPLVSVSFSLMGAAEPPFVLFLNNFQKLSVRKQMVTRGIHTDVHHILKEEK